MAPKTAVSPKVREWARCFCAVSAGLVETGALEYFENREGMLDYYRSRTPAGRLVEPGDVADAVCFLASAGADMIRGQTIVVDGGYSVLA